MFGGISRKARKSARLPTTPGFPLKPDIARNRRNVSNGALPDENYVRHHPIFLRTLFARPVLNDLDDT
jgi:hypothetical protein